MNLSPSWSRPSSKSKQESDVFDAARVGVNALLIAAD